MCPDYCMALSVTTTVCRIAMSISFYLQCLSEMEHAYMHAFAKRCVLFCLNTDVIETLTTNVFFFALITATVKVVGEFTDLK